MSFLNKIISLHTTGKDKKQSGFTIVEVMIVLAIAGLVLAVVFVAVPALQRSQRNSARQNDLAYLRTQYDTAAAQNNGRRPSLDQYKNLIKDDELNWLGKGSGGNDAVAFVALANTAAATGGSCSSGGHLTEAACTGATETWTPSSNDGKIFYNNSGVATGATHLISGSGNTVVMYVGYVCATAPTNNSIAPANIAQSNRNSVAWMYIPEGQNVIICTDDVN